MQRPEAASRFENRPPGQDDNERLVVLGDASKAALKEARLEAEEIQIERKAEYLREFNQNFSRYTDYRRWQKPFLTGIAKLRTHIKSGGKTLASGGPLGKYNLFKTVESHMRLKSDKQNIFAGSGVGLRAITNGNEYRAESRDELAALAEGKAQEIREAGGGQDDRGLENYLNILVADYVRKDAVTDADLEELIKLFLGEARRSHSGDRTGVAHSELYKHTEVFAHNLRPVIQDIREEYRQALQVAEDNQQDAGQVQIGRAQLKLTGDIGGGLDTNESTDAISLAHSAVNRAGTGKGALLVNSTTTALALSIGGKVLAKPFNMLLPFAGTALVGTAIGYADAKDRYTQVGREAALGRARHGDGQEVLGQERHKILEHVVEKRDASNAITEISQLADRIEQAGPRPDQAEVRNLIDRTVEAEARLLMGNENKHDLLSFSDNYGKERTRMQLRAQIARAKTLLSPSDRRFYDGRLGDRNSELVGQIDQNRQKFKAYARTYAAKRGGLSLAIAAASWIGIDLAINGESQLPEDVKSSAKPRGILGKIKSVFGEDSQSQVTHAPIQTASYAQETNIDFMETGGASLNNAIVEPGEDARVPLNPDGTPVHSDDAFGSGPNQKQPTHESTPSAETAPPIESMTLSESLQEHEAQQGPLEERGDINNDYDTGLKFEYNEQGVSYKVVDGKPTINLSAMQPDANADGIIERPSSAPVKIVIYLTEADYQSGNAYIYDASDFEYNQATGDYVIDAQKNPELAKLFEVENGQVVQNFKYMRAAHENSSGQLVYDATVVREDIPDSLRSELVSTNKEIEKSSPAPEGQDESRAVTSSEQSEQPEQPAQEPEQSTQEPEADQPHNDTETNSIPPVLGTGSPWLAGGYAAGYDNYQPLSKINREQEPTPPEGTATDQDPDRDPDRDPDPGRQPRDPGGTTPEPPGSGPIIEGDGGQGPDDDGDNDPPPPPPTPRPTAEAPAASGAGQNQENVISGNENQSNQTQINANVEGDSEIGGSHTTNAKDNSTAISTGNNSPVTIGVSGSELAEIRRIEQEGESQRNQDQLDDRRDERTQARLNAEAERNSTNEDRQREREGNQQMLESVFEYIRQSEESRDRIIHSLLQIMSGMRQGQSPEAPQVISESDQKVLEIYTAQLQSAFKIIEKLSEINKQMATQSSESSQQAIASLAQIVQDLAEQIKASNREAGTITNNIVINANNSNSQQTIEQARQLRQEFDQLDNNISQFMSSSYFSPERRQQRRQQSQERISQRRSGAQRRPRATKNIYTGLPETPMQGSLQRDLRGPINNQPEAPVQGPLQSELAEPMVNQPEAPIQGPLQSELAEPIVNQPEGPMQGPLGSELQEPQPNFNDETQQRAREARLENWLDRHSDSVDISSNQSIFDNIRSVSYPELKQRYRQQYDAYRPILKNMIDAYKKDWESGASTPEQRREWLARLRSGEIFDQIAQQSGS